MFKVSHRNKTNQDEKGKNVEKGKGSFIFLSFFFSFK